MSPRRRTPPTARDFIVDRALELTPTEIRRAMFADPFLAAMGVPSLRTVQSIVTEAKASQPKHPDIWRVIDADPESAAAVTAVIAAVGPRRAEITVGHAERIAWLRKGWPDIPAQECFDVARTIAAFPDSASRLVSYLGHAPWRDGGKSYVAAYTAHQFTELFLTASSRARFDQRTKEKKAPEPKPERP